MVTTLALTPFSKPVYRDIVSVCKSLQDNYYNYYDFFIYHRETRVNPYHIFRSIQWYEFQRALLAWLKIKLKTAGERRLRFNAVRN